MSFIELSSSSYSSNTFGIQSAATSFTDGFITTNDTRGILYTQGCNVIGSRDCATACQDPAQIFMSPYTLQNCMVLSVLAPSNWLQPNETTSPLSNWTQPLSTEAIGIATEFGIDTTSPDFPSLASNVSQTMHECFVEYYNANTQQDGYNNAFLPWYLTSTALFPINETKIIPAPIYTITCPFEAPLNQDIGGIGVSHRFAD